MTLGTGRENSGPRVYGTTQNVQNLLHPSITETNALGPTARGAGRRSNFSISGKLTSTTGARSRRAASTIAGRRCSVCGPNTTSTKGARAVIAAPSWLATQPPTPMTTCGLAALRARQRPSWLKTFSAAFSRMEQVLSSSTSAAAGSSTTAAPWLSRSTSAIRDESYSFIWQPWVSR